MNVRSGNAGARALRGALLGLLLVLCGLGTVAYLGWNVLVPPWLWANQDYMLYLGQHYYHLHYGLMIGHVFLWGPVLLRKDRTRWGSLYATSFAVAYVITAVPLLPIERVRSILGAGTYWAIVVYHAALIALFVKGLVRRPDDRGGLWSFHAFSGYPLALLVLQAPIPAAVPAAAAAWGLLLVFATAALLIGRGGDEPIGGPSERRRGEGGGGGVVAVNVLVLLVASAVCLLHHPLQLLYAKYELETMLTALHYASIPIAPRRANVPAPAPANLKYRTYDGSWNNLNYPEVGMANTPLGRYLPESGRVPRDVNAAPSPIEISATLLKQDKFQSAAPINALAMAWVNFFVHDFYNRGVGDTLTTTLDDPIKLPVEGGKFVYISKLKSGDGATHNSSVTHWFDASQVYGSSEATAKVLRSGVGGRLKIGTDGFLPVNDQGVFLTGDTPRSSLHLGSMMMHHLWASEHNHVAGELQKRYPEMTDEDLFQTGRLIVAAEIVKVHTVEWTAQLVADPVSADFLQSFFDRFGTEPYRDDLWYAVSEEFISSYILHEILPPVFDLVDQDGKVTRTTSFVNDLFHEGGQKAIREHGLANTLNSFGTNAMGLIHVFNVPDEFHRYTKIHELLARIRPGSRPADDAGYLDLAAIPVARDRDARVPFYNEMREHLGLARLRNIAEVSADPRVVKTLEALYKDVDKIEYLIGYKAEARPSSWALTPTQVNTFLPVVTYRIIADRFYTKDFHEGVYTRYGMERIKAVKFHDIIKQAYGPMLLPASRDAPIFHQWRSIPRVDQDQAGPAPKP